MDFNIIHYQQLPSTNIHALDLLHAKKAKEGDVIWADYQSEGRGQRGTHWSSCKGENLLFSLVLEPDLAVDQQFRLSILVALAIKHFLDKLAVGKVEIKWPNDILIDERKVAGVLIQNNLSGSQIKSSVIGIGLNVNQTQFETSLRDAISLQLLSGKEFDVKYLLQELLDELWKNYLEIHQTEWEELKENYCAALHAYQLPYIFQDEDGTFKGKIVGLTPSGQLVVQKGDLQKFYYLKELSFIRKG